jgi:hypothetical protein
VLLLLLVGRPHGVLLLLVGSCGCGCGHGRGRERVSVGKGGRGSHPGRVHGRRPIPIVGLALVEGHAQ